MERLGEEVRRELGRFGPAGGMADVVAAWPDAVGDAIARNAWPARLARDGTLHVSTASSAWAYELGLLAETVRERLEAALGDAAPPRLRFSPGPLPEPTREQPPDLPEPRITPSLEQRRLGVELAAGIADDELRELAARAVSLGLARAGDGRAL